MFQTLPYSPQGAFPDLIPEEAQRADGALALQLECEARMRAEGQVDAAAPPRSEPTPRVGMRQVLSG
jgi:hypothetical protein